MNHITLTRAATLALLLAVSMAHAQPAAKTADHPGVYIGPSSVPLQNAKQILDVGKDNQKARMQGRIVSFDGDERYTFVDATGRMAVKISSNGFPSGQNISAEQNVELVGEVDKDFRKVEFDVEQVRLMPTVRP